MKGSIGVGICAFGLLAFAAGGQQTAGERLVVANGPVRIRKTELRPFADGRRIEDVWRRADVFGGFVVPEKLDVALDRSEVQMLYDEAKLYVSCKGFFDKKYANRPVDARLFRDNNFELFFACAKGAARYRQFAFSEGGLTYFGEFADGGKRELRRPSTFAFDVEEGDGCWAANMEIPLAALGVENIREGMELAVQIARNNVSTYGKKREASVWAALEKMDYSDTARWGTAVFAADDASEPRFVRGPDNGASVNLFANPEFDVPDRGWTVVGKGRTYRMETMAMSGEWIYRTIGDSYHFLKGVPSEYESGQDYTLAVSARGFGGEAVLNVLELCTRAADGKICEGTHIADKVVLGTEFRTYYFPFKSTGKGKPLCMMFYKAEPRDADDRGLDVASIRLFKGKVGALQFRKVHRSGRKAIAGPGVPIPDCGYGTAVNPAKGLVVAFRIREQREILELFKGSGVDVDILMTTAPDQDVYDTDGDIPSIEKKLDGNGYDFYCVLRNAAARVGKELAEKIVSGVRKGAGVYFGHNSDYGNLKPLVEGADLMSVDPNDALVCGYPGRIKEKISRTNIDVLLREGRFGAGPVLEEASGRDGVLKFMMDPAVYGTTDFPFSSFCTPLQVRTFLRLAGKLKPCDGEVQRVFWRTADQDGMYAADGVSDNEESALRQASESCVVAGRHAVSLRFVDANDRTLDWRVRFIDKVGPRLELLAERASCDGDEDALFVANVQGGARNGGVEWTLEDFSGRIIESGRAKPNESFSVPTKALYTNLGILRARFVVGGRVCAAARTNLYACDRDASRLYDDFVISIWGQRGGCSRDSFPLVDRQLQEIGVRHQLLPITEDRWTNLPVPSMADGMSCGGGFLGRDTWYYPRKLDGSNNRSSYGPVNTKRGRSESAANAEKVARSSGRVGVLGYCVCDEPNLVERFTTDEPDEEPENVSEYRIRMEGKYGTIAEFNRRHQTTHASFADLAPAHLADARKSGKFAEYVEWRNFNVDRWCEAIRLLSDAAKRVDKRTRMSLFETFGQTAASGNDYWKLLTKAGLDFSSEYTAMVSMKRDPIYNFDEFYRSFRPDMRVWGFTGYAIGAKQIAFTPWWTAMHRYGGFAWFAVMDWDWRFLDQPSWAFTQDALDVRDAVRDSRLQDGLGKLLLTYDWVPREIAIYYSHDSLLTATAMGTEKISFVVDAKGPLHDYMYSRQGAQYLVEDLLYQHDFVAPEQVMSGKLKDYKVLFMPSIFALSDAEVVAIREFRRRGGRVIADRLPGDYDELGVKRLTNPFASDGIEVTGKIFDDLEPQQRVATAKSLSESGATPIVRSEGIESIYGREAMHFTDGVNDLFSVIRMPTRSEDETEQTFVFPKKGHLYDVREGKYLGVADAVTAKVPNAGAGVWAILPKQVGVMSLSLPDTVRAGGDLVADISLEGAIGSQVFHAEVVSPNGGVRFHMKRNLKACDGCAKLVFRMAENDTPGRWRLTVRDALTGTSCEKTFSVVNK